MSRWTHYLDRAGELVTGYTGESPLGTVLKDYFRTRRQMGATDRRFVTDLVYAFYRLGHSVTGLPVPARLLLGYFLCQEQPSPLMEALRPAWAGSMELTLEQKRAMLTNPFHTSDIFPWTTALSPAIDAPVFVVSHLHQPDVYIRLRPGKEILVRDVLTEKGISFRQSGEHGLRVAPHTSLQTLLPVNAAYVVQDKSSQQVGQLMQEAFSLMNVASPSVWDCCAASGGKAILLKDLMPSARLTVSDIRPAILTILHSRLKEAGVAFDSSFAADLSLPLRDIGPFDLVVADVPCTGSGTWSRTPEQLYYFTEGRIDAYVIRQRAILQQVAKTVRTGGYLLLVTCSVFEAENESNVVFLERLGFRPGFPVIFEGYRDRADTLFGCLMEKM